MSGVVFPLRCANPYLNVFETGSDARNGIGTWISEYNEKRPHSSHGLRTLPEAYDTQNQYLNAAA
ncbi:integrase core domain-containing protein [Marinovum sp. 1_MG-2023]|uniref:integrase core domain-containing protein n=1 Tax=Marinovum sp. 1_MG-2023 TaxID=3062633 RepID=UPI003FA5F006